MKILLFLSDSMIPLLIFSIVGYGLLCHGHVYDDFIKGAKDGFQTAEHAGFDESMTIFDVLCCSKPGCHLSGEYATVTNLPGIANISAPGTGTYAETARIFANNCDALRRACERLGGSAQKVGDVSYRIPLFDFMPVILQFWDADEEFDAALKIMWDTNTLDFMRFETTFYAANHLLERLKELKY